MIIPVSAILLGYAVIGEKLTLHEVVGALVIGLALVIIDGRALKFVGLVPCTITPPVRGRGTCCSGPGEGETAAGPHGEIGPGFGFHAVTVEAAGFRWLHVGEECRKRLHDGAVVPSATTDDPGAGWRWHVGARGGDGACRHGHQCCRAIGGAGARAGFGEAVAVE